MWLIDWRPVARVSGRPCSGQWPAHRLIGVLVRSYVLTAATLMLSVGVFSTVVAGAPSAVAGIAVPALAVAPGGSFVALPPTRLLDTRRTTGPGTDVYASFTGAVSVPASAVSAVLVNVTVVDAVGRGYSQVTPGGNAGGASNGNFAARMPSASLTLTGTYGSSGVRVFTSVRANVVVDLQGYVTTPDQVTADSFTPVAAVRVADSRLGAGLSTFTTGRTQTLDLRTRAGLPATAKAVIANLTIAGAGAPTYVTAWSGAGPRPTVSNINAARGEIVANRTLLPLDVDGRIALFNASGRTDVVVDVVGWVGVSPTGSYYTPGYSNRAHPRLADSGNPVTSVTVSAAIGPVPPTAADRAPSTDDLQPTTAVWLALVGDQPVGRGYLTAGPGGAAPGRTSDLNLVPDRAVANSGPVLLGDDGTVTVTASARTRIVVDSSGWFQRAATPPASGLWSTYAPTFGQPTVVSTRATGLPDWFVEGLFGATPFGVGVVSATAVAPDGTVWRATAPGAYSADTNRWNDPTPVVGLADITALAGPQTSSDAAVYALRGDGTVLGFGRNANGELARQPSTDPVTAPVRIPLPAAAVRIAASDRTGYAVLADGTVWSWGQGTARLGRPATDTPWVPMPVAGLDGPVAIDGNSSVVVAIDADGTSRWWGTAATVPATPTPVTGSGVCPVTTSLHADSQGVWELCSNHIAKQIANDHAAVLETVGGNGFITLGASSLLDNVRVLYPDGRVADLATNTVGRYEAGFTDVTAIGGSSAAAVTLVDASTAAP